MKYLLGLLIALYGFQQASDHLNQDFTTYWDVVAFFVVLFGTTAVLAISLPNFSFFELAKKFLLKFFRFGDSLQESARKCAKVVSTSTALNKTVFIEEQLLNDGLELISLGFNRDKIEEILTHRYQNYSRQINLIVSWLRRNSKYPPAFGLAGTVLGLIHLMRGISAGIDAKEIGIRMAVALVATFYGLLLSNLVLNPMSEWLTEELKKDEVKAEMAILSILNLSERANVLEVQELLNSYLEPSKRLDLISETLIGEAA